MEEANHLIETGEKAYIAKGFPNATGDTTKPKQVFPESQQTLNSLHHLTPPGYPLPGGFLGWLRGYQTAKYRNG